MYTQTENITNMVIAAAISGLFTALLVFYPTYKVLSDCEADIPRSQHCELTASPAKWIKHEKENK